MSEGLNKVMRTGNLGADEKLAEDLSFAILQIHALRKRIGALEAKAQQADVKSADAPCKRTGPFAEKRTMALSLVRLIHSRDADIAWETALDCNHGGDFDVVYNRLKAIAEFARRTRREEWQEEEQDDDR